MTDQSGRALVTGGAGFIGSHVSEALLARGWDVWMIDSFTDYYGRSIKEANIAKVLDGGGSLIEDDITNGAGMAEVFDELRPDVVVHLAAWAGVRPSIERPALYSFVNVTGTQILLNEAVRTGAKRFVCASSSSVYGNNKKVPFSEEDDVSHPISPYAATKVSTEMICKAASHLHGLPITALRFFTVFGPRQRPDLAIQKFMTRIANGETIPVFGDGTMSRDFTYVDDIVDGVMRAVERCGEVERYRCYNLGGDHPVSVKDLIGAIEHVVGKKAVIDWQEEQPGDVRQTWADLTRSGTELGYSPQTRIESGLEKQWVWNQSCEVGKVR